MPLVNRQVRPVLDFDRKVHRLVRFVTVDQGGRPIKKARSLVVLGQQFATIDVDVYRPTGEKNAAGRFEYHYSHTIFGKHVG